MQLQLNLRPTDSPQRAAAAWLVPGKSCAVWLQELTAWNVELQNVRLLPLSVGLLVITPQDISQRKSPTTLAYGLLTDNVFLPVNARLNAALSAAELQMLFPSGKTYVWHPAAGLLVTDPAAGTWIGELLAVPPERSSDWSRAVVGIAFNGRILSLAPSERSSVDELWREEQNDIGSQSPTLDNLPRSPHEPSSGPLSRLGRGMKSAAAKLVQWISRPGQSAPGAGQIGTVGKRASGGLGSWGSGLARWAAERLARLTAALEEERHREVARLLHMLDSDPDTGIRFAIPFSGDPGGTGAPSSRLAERDVSFRLGGGGGSCDTWDISPNHRIRLLARYRELANREITLGRYRRAAYIFAHLLGDFGAAAHTLADGGHFREAAILYEQKLSQPLDAAKALERGGLWTEAIAIYERLGHDEKVGDLYQQLGQPETAATHFRREVLKAQRLGDPLSAARLLEVKLAAPEEAIAVLTDAWPESTQAISCAKELFRVLGRRGEHDLAESHVRQLTQTIGSRVSLGSELATAFEALALNYPAANVREVAADHVRLLAAEFLEEASSKELQDLTSALRKSTPQDALLRGDVQRYLQQRSERPLVSTSRKPSIELRRQIELGSGQWITFCSTGERFYAAGIREGKYVVARGGWTGPVQFATHPNWGTEFDAGQRPLLLAVHEGLGQAVLHSALGRPIDGQAVLPQTGDQPRVIVGSHRGLGGWDANQLVVAMGYTDQSTFDVVKFHDLTGEYVWSSHALLASNLNGTWRLDPRAFAEGQFAEGPIADGQRAVTEALSIAGQLYCGIGSRLCVFNRDGLASTVELPSNVCRLTASRLWTRQRLVVSLDEGGMIFWDGVPIGPHARFGEGLGNPHTCLTRGGLLIVAADGMLEAYDSRDGKLSMLSIKAEPACQPRGLAATNRPDQFAMLKEDGMILVYGLENWR